MTLEDLRVFAAVCEEANLSAVARRLGRTQSAVSQHVARLEREVGTPLLERRARGVAPTAAGKLLYEGCRSGLASIASAVRAIEALRAGSAGRLAISTGGTTVRHFLRDAVVRFRRRHPDVALHFEPGSSTDACLDALRREKADLAFVTIAGELRGFDHRVVLESLPFLLVAADDPLATRRRVRVSDLRGLRYVALADRTSSRSLIRRALEQEGVSIRPSVVVDDFDTAALFVELGLGHTIVPALHARHFARTGRVRAIRIEGLPPVPVGWAARSWAALPAVALTFVDLFARSASRWRRLPGIRVRDGARPAGASG